MKIKIDEKDKEWIEKVLNDLSFVQWDRYWTDAEVNDDIPTLLTTFGWIKHVHKAYRDFVILDFTLKANANPSNVYFLGCSSPSYSESIANSLGCKHTNCKRVESMFDIENKIVLESVV